MGDIFNKNAAMVEDTVMDKDMDANTLTMMWIQTFMTFLIVVSKTYVNQMMKVLRHVALDTVWALTLTDSTLKTDESFHPFSNHFCSAGLPGASKWAFSWFNCWQCVTVSHGQYAFGLFGCFKEVAANMAQR